MRDVFLYGSGLDCALGRNQDACVTALWQRQVNTTALNIDAFQEPLSLRYFRIGDDAELLDPGRLERLLPPVVMAATNGLTASQRRRMPLFIGSSCFSVAQSEAEHARAMKRYPDAALALPHVGFQTIAEIARRATQSEAIDLTWNTACTSSANALLAAARMIAQGQIDHALVVGAEVANLTTISGFSGLRLLTDRVRPFDIGREGIVLGEAIGAVVLSNESVAGNDRFRLRDGAANCDTHGVTTSNPDGSALAAVQRQALQAAGITADDISVIKAHATGTPANDASETNGLRRIYDTLPPVTAFKPFVGHTLGACGIVELVMLAGALDQGFVPASPAIETIDPLLDVRPLDEPLRADSGFYQLNQFGFGGNNAVMVLEAR